MKYCDSTILDRGISKKVLYDSALVGFFFPSHFKNANFILLSGTKIRPYSFSLVRQQNQKGIQIPLLMEFCCGREMV